MKVINSTEWNQKTKTTMDFIVPILVNLIASTVLYRLWGSGGRMLYRSSPVHLSSFTPASIFSYKRDVHPKEVDLLFVHGGANGAL